MPSTAEKKRIVADFLNRCNHYAEGQIAHYGGQLDAADTMAAVALRDKIGHWQAYRAFNEYAIGELAGSGLDDWFED